MHWYDFQRKWQCPACPDAIGNTEDDLVLIHKECLQLLLTFRQMFVPEELCPTCQKPIEKELVEQVDGLFADGKLYHHDCYLSDQTSGLTFAEFDERVKALVKEIEKGTHDPSRRTAVQASQGDGSPPPPHNGLPSVENP